MIIFTMSCNHQGCSENRKSIPLKVQLESKKIALEIGHKLLPDCIRNQYFYNGLQSSRVVRKRKEINTSQDAIESKQSALEILMYYESLKIILSSGTRSHNEKNDIASPIQQLLDFSNEVNYRATTRYSLLTCIKQLDRGRVVI